LLLSESNGPCGLPVSRAFLVRGLAADTDTDTDSLVRREAAVALGQLGALAPPHSGLQFGDE
jgi:HEAT repeat protein